MSPLFVDIRFRYYRTNCLNKLVRKNVLQKQSSSANFTRHYFHR